MSVPRKLLILPQAGLTKVHQAATAPALPPGSGPQSPHMALEPAKLEGSEGKSGLQSRSCPLPHLQNLAWGVFHYL